MLMLLVGKPHFNNHWFKRSGRHISSLKFIKSIYLRLRWSQKSPRNLVKYVDQQTLSQVYWLRITRRAPQVILMIREFGETLLYQTQSTISVFGLRLEQDMVGRSQAFKDSMQAPGEMGKAEGGSEKEPSGSQFSLTLAHCVQSTAEIISTTWHASLLFYQHYWMGSAGGSWEYK